MTIDLHHRELRQQAAALRAAAVQAGPDAVVPTCPNWDVAKLLRHLGRVYATVALATTADPDGERPQPPAAPEEFDKTLAWWDEQLGELVERLGSGDADRPVWAFFPGGTPRSWTRRMAHETAIHRLDAEHALTSTGTDHVHDLLFSSEFAADGIDEHLSVLLPGTRDWSDQHGDGHVLFHAADAGRAWMVSIRPEQPPEVSAPHDAALGRDEVDANVAGTADAVYRRVWGRPSSAVVTGDTELAGLVKGR